MATKAEKFRGDQVRRANPPKPKQAPRPRRDQPVDTAKPGVSATDRRVGAGSTAVRNVSKRAARKAGPILEDSATGKPSRRSTRKTIAGSKTTSNLERRQTRRVSAPKSRATRAKAEKAKS